MITMRNITKSYHMGENVVHALRCLLYTSRCV